MSKFASTNSFSHQPGSNQIVIVSITSSSLAAIIKIVQDSIISSVNCLSLLVVISIGWDNVKLW